MRLIRQIQAFITRPLAHIYIDNNAAIVTALEALEINFMLKF